MDQLTFGDFITQYYMPHIAHKDSITINANLGLLHRYVFPVLESVLIGSIDLGHVQAVHAYMQECRTSKEYESRLSTVLYQIFQLAQSMGMLKHNPYDADFSNGRTSARQHPYVQIQPRKTAWLTPEELRIMVPCFQRHEIKDFFLLCLFTGLRYQELAALSEEDYDPVSHTLRIHRIIKRISENHHLLLSFMELPESDRACRTIKLSSTADSTVQSAILNCIQDIKRNPHQLLFTIPSGKPVCYARLHDYCSTIRQQTGIYRFRLSMLRTTFAVASLNHGWTAAELMLLCTKRRLMRLRPHFNPAVLNKLWMEDL